MRKRILFIAALLSAACFVLGCTNVFEEETAWSDAAGNRVIYDWGFGDATVKYRSAAGGTVSLCSYAYADSNERMTVHVSDDARTVCLFVSTSTNAQKYPAGSGLLIYRLTSTESGVTVAQEASVCDTGIRSVQAVTAGAVTYTDASGTARTVTLEPAQN